MPEISSYLDQLSRYARRIAANTRPHHVVAVLAVAVVGIGLAGVSAMALPEPRPVLDGEKLRIQVVAPVEPDIAAGPEMDVGQLVNALKSAPPSYVAAEPAAYVSQGEDFEDFEDTGPRNPPRPPQPYIEDAFVHAPPRPEPAERPVREGRVARWFGFDGPERDYRAEREARRARREARMERDRDGRERRWYRSDGRPVDDRELDREQPRREDYGPPPYYRD